MISLLLVLGFFCSSYAIYYDPYSETPLSEDQLNLLGAKEADWCVNNIQPCDSEEGRRVDGSCNNLDNPVPGSKHARFYSILPTILESDADHISKGESGKELPLARELRTKLLSEGSVSSDKYTNLLTSLLVFLGADVVSNHDSRNYVLNTTICCQPEHMNDYECASNMIPDDDPVHRFSQHRCINMTRPLTFQSQGCIAKGSPPERISEATPMIDLSVVYGQSGTLDSYRTFTNGQFKSEIINGKAWPLNTKPEDSPCKQNHPTETRCHDAPDLAGSNSLLPVNLFFMLFWRLHNLIAEELAKVNPCWSDQKVFDTARDMNIAIANHIYYYEALADFMGKDRMLRDGVLSSHCGFRDIYDKTLMPRTSLEYSYVLRWVHTMQEDHLELYDESGNIVDTVQVVKATLRTGYLATGNNSAYITQGSFRQACGAADFTVASDMAQLGLGDLQEISDLPANDLAKGRYFGFQPYYKYREYCSGKAVTSWDDLKDVMNEENIEKLQKMYGSYKDVELLAGIWVEDYLPESNAPPTFYCVMKDQLLRYIKSDRHWFERSERPHAFTLPQLLEIRKSTVARLLCDVGDSVTEVQPKAFMRYGPGNEITSCDNIEKIDFSQWKDPTCDSE